jgi:hypothetical protein
VFYCFNLFSITYCLIGQSGAHLPQGLMAAYNYAADSNGASTCEFSFIWLKVRFYR